MSPQIEVDNEVLALLGAKARPFVDTEPNHVLRRLLGLSGQADGVEDVLEENASDIGSTRGAASGSGDGGRRKGGVRMRSKKTHSRAKKGTLLDESAYWMPILRALDEKGGRAAASEVIERVGELIDDQLLAADREMLETGAVRWQTRTQFARLRMKEESLIAPDSPRGIWEITDKGTQHLLAGNTTAA